MVLKQLKTEFNLQKTIKQRDIRYFGHVKRRNCFLNIKMEGKTEGKRPRGRPRTTWTEMWRNGLVEESRSARGKLQIINSSQPRETR